MSRLSPEILAKIKHIQLQTKRRLTSTLAGEHRSRNKGFGLDFDQIREYQLGDDVRFIDWKSSARTGNLLVKQYIHEHNKTIMLVVDRSSSTLFSSTQQSKAERFSEIGTILSLVSDHYGAQLGLIEFTDKIVGFIPPKRGKKQMHQIIAKMWDQTHEHEKTSIAQALSFLTSLKRKDTIVVFLSDLIDTDFSQVVAAVNKRYELIALRCLDRREYSLPRLGYLRVQDPETGHEMMLDLKNDDHMSPLFFMRQRLQRQDTTLKKQGVDCITLWQDEPYIDHLIQFFSRRVVV